MSEALHKFSALVKLEQLEKNLFRGQSEDIGLPQVFGGQVVSQALFAARQTTPDERNIHSFHSNFLQPGDSQKNIVYAVEILRDGSSFSARRISAIQNGQTIFVMTASFQSDETGYEHHKTMPPVPAPETLTSETEITLRLARHPNSEKYKKFLAPKPLEMRPVKFHNPLQGKTDEPVRQIWLRANGTLPADSAIHQSLLSYASDYNFLPVALQPHGRGFLEPEMQVATLDHAMWFHRPFDLNQWLLYNIESPSASGARGFVRGEFYSQDGKLIASTAQEGLIRFRH